MTTTTLPTLAPATLTRDADGYTVTVQWHPHPELDRLDAYAWGLGPNHVKLAERLVRAVDAGAVIVPSTAADLFTDVAGARGCHARSRILARMMHAELTRLGY